MTTFTDKELIKEIKERISSMDVRDNVERRAYEIALASLEAEPVAWMRDDADGREYNARNEFSGGGGGVPLYATPPAPVVPEEKPIPNPLSMYAVDAVAAIAEVRGWNACRAAMLHSAEPASNHEELPLDYLQGQKDGLEWAAQLAEANHPQTGDWLYDDPLELAKAIRKGPDMPEFDGPTPVTPDGWISCSERMPEETGDIIVVSDGIVMSGISYSRRDGFYIAALEYDDDEPIGGVTHWMLLPEPPQEVK
ncbi:TPA: DUF551 domain-containing protein [Escherichia coli]|nr:DUF551 domain-containing protein [Escherichia coli]